MYENLIFCAFAPNIDPIKILGGELSNYPLPNTNKDVSIDIPPVIVLKGYEESTTDLSKGKYYLSALTRGI